MLSSGKNIYPEDVEKLYLGSPLIKEICILGIGSQGITESLHAVIVPDFEYAKQAGISNIQEAIKWEINKLSGKIPSYYEGDRILHLQRTSSEDPSRQIEALHDKRLISAGLLRRKAMEKGGGLRRLTKRHS